MPKGEYKVLGVDDSADDLFLLQRALSRSRSLRLVATAADGREAIACLGGDGTIGEARVVPDLVLLDLKMPGIDGFGVLEWLQRHPLPNARVVVFTSSLDAADRCRALELGAHDFHIKPANPAGYAKFAILLEELLAETGDGLPAG